MRPDTNFWSICQDLKGNKAYMREFWSSNSVDGHRCPAITNAKDWGFNTNADGKGANFESGEVVLNCSTHVI